LKILHVVRQFLPTVGGLEQSVLHLARRLQERGGCEIRIVTLDRSFQQPEQRLPGRERLEDLDVIRIPYWGSRRYPVAPRVLGQLAWGDIVHVHAIDFFFDFLALTKLAHRKPLVATTHGGFFHTTYAAGFKRAYFNSVTPLSAKSYARICATSEADADLFRRISPRNVVTIENGVDRSKLAGAASDTYQRTMIYFGRLSSNKRIDALFPILRDLRCVASDWRLIVAGTSDDVSIGDLSTSALQAGVGDAVQFVDRPSDIELVDLVGQASYFVSASAHEGFGIAAVEAMSAGLVPILTRIPSFERFAREAGAGLLFDPMSTAESVTAIVELDRLQPFRLEGDKRRLECVARQYDWPSVAERYFEQYRLALQSVTPN
jgi:alpha-1,3-mannosyltransferase